MIRIARALSRLGSLIAVALAVGGGAAFITGTAALAESGLRSHPPVGRLGGADVVVSARQYVPQDEDLPLALPERAVVPEGLVARLAGLPGVAEATGDLSFPAAMPAGRGKDPGAAGHGWSSAALLGAGRITGTPPAGPGEVAVAAGASGGGTQIGDRIRIIAAGEMGTYRVTATVDVPEEGFFFADGPASRLAGRDDGPRRGTVDLVALRAAAGTAPKRLAAGVRTVVGEGYEVATGSSRGDVRSPGTATARLMLLFLAAAIAGIVLLIVAFVVAGALSVSVDRQRRDLALLRVTGATPRQIRRIVAVQATAAALVALAPGVLLGYLLAQRLGDMLIGLGVLPPDLPLTWSPASAGAAVILLLPAVRASAWGAAVGVSRGPVTEVVSARGGNRRPAAFRTYAGLLLIAGSLPLSIFPLLVRSADAAAGTAIAGILAVIGLAFAGPWLMRAASGALAGRMRLRRPPAWLGLRNVHGHALRSAGAVSALAMVVALTLTYALTQTTVMTATQTDLAVGTRADASVTAPGLGGIPHALFDEVRAAPGVSAAARVSTTTAMLPFREDGKNRAEGGPALVLEPDARGLIDPAVREGDLKGLTGATVAVPVGSGDVGARMKVILGDGTQADARIVATYERRLGFGSVILSRDLVAGHTTTGLDSAVLVRLARPDALTGLEESWPGVQIIPGMPGSLGGGAPAEVWVNLAVLSVLLGYVVFTVVGRLVTATAGRRAEFRLLRRIGATSGQLRAAVRRESMWLAAAAVVGGGLASAAPLILLGAGFLGRPWPAGPGWLPAACAAAVALIAWAAIEIPARRAMR